MSTDRELLELAAKAAGYGLPDKGDHDEIGRQYDYHLGLWTMWDYGQWDWFRPHLNDGQAMRLVVKLRLFPKVFRDFAMCGSEQISENAGQAIQEFYADHKGDIYAATRRAIVRAAAEIGKTQ